MGRLLDGFKGFIKNFGDIEKAKKNILSPLMDSKIMEDFGKASGLWKKPDPNKEMLEIIKKWDRDGLPRSK